MAEKTKDKQKFEEYSLLSTKCVNSAENYTPAWDQLKNLSTGFILFSKEDYVVSESYFSNILENKGKSDPNNQFIYDLAKFIKAIIAYNKCNYKQSIQILTELIRENNFINESVLESLGLCFFNSGDVKKAKKIFEKCLTLVSLII